MSRAFSDLLVKNSMTLANLTQNVVVYPIAQQIAYRNMTTVKVISEVISSLSTFPWAATLKQFRLLNGEAERLGGLIKLLGNDQYIGLVVSGLNAGYANLGYLCHHGVPKGASSWRP